MWATLIFKGISAWWTARQEVKKADMVNAAARAKAGLSDKYKYLQWITFGMMLFPFALAYYAPETSDKFWKSVASMPPWFVELFVYMILAIWGYSVAQKGVMQMLNGLQKWHRNIKRGD